MKLIPKFLDPTDITTLVNKGTGKHVIADGFSTIPIYKGKQYSIKDVVNNDGTVNIRKAKKIMEEVAEYFGGKKMQNRLENPIWHKDDPNTWLHTKKVAQNAWAIPVPEGYTKQDQMIAALGHDFGKILSGDGHAEVSYNLIKQIFPDATPKQLEAVRRHMDDLGTHTDLLEQATKFADIGATPKADLTQLGLTPEELEIVKQTKWFKEGGNIQYFDKGGTVYKLLNELYHKVNKGIPLAEWSPEQWDQVYNYVLKRYGEKESNILQKIRDYHFWAKAPNTKLSEVSGKPIEVVHHTNSDPFTVFDKKRRGQTDSGHRGLGYYFDSKQTYNPEIYGKNTISAYLNIQNPIQGSSRKNLSTLDDVDQYIINLGKGTRNELIAERVAKGLGKDSEEISDLIIISKYYLKQRRVNKSYKNYIPEDLKTLGLKADSSDLEIEQAVENKVKELLQKEAERYYPKNFDSIDGYMDEYENVVYSPIQIKSSASITRDDQGNIIPLSQRDNFNNEDIRFKDGGTLKLQEGGVLQENTQPLFRHLPNEYIAQDFDNDLNELFYSRQIKYGQLSEKAERKLQKKYNLDYTQLKETLDDLFNAGKAQAMVADILYPNKIDTFKNGGSLVPKYSLGKAIETITDAAKPIEKIFTASGRVKEFGAETAQKLWTSAKATGDRRLFGLASIANKSRMEHIAYPEEFVNYVDSILKSPITKQVDTKTTKSLSADGVTPRKSQTSEYLFAQNPKSGSMQIIEVPKAPKTARKTIHTGEFKDKNTFVRKTITKKELESKTEDIDLALQAFRDIENGEFKVSEKMIQDIYSKSYGKVSNHLDEAINTSTIRHEFNFYEYPQILMNQLTQEGVQIPLDTYGQFSYENIKNLKKLYKKLEKETPGHIIVPVTRTPKGSPYGLRELVVGPDFNFSDYKFRQLERKMYESGYKQGIPEAQIKEAVENYRKNLTRDPRLKGQETSDIFFPGQSVIAGAGDEFVMNYAFKNPVTGKLTAIPKLEEHHALALAEQMARAYLKNPKPLNPEEMLSLYKGQREVDFLNRFYLLTKPQHTGTMGIHYHDEFTLQDLGRIKNLSRMYKFKDLNELLDYYRNIVTKRNAFFAPKAKSGTKLIPKKINIS